ncbi:MAG: DUF1508 domain-containing protein [Burkholderiales bacterium]
MQYAIYKDDHGYWRWRLVTSDNVHIALGAQQYRTQGECLAAVAQVKQSTDSRIMLACEKSAG